MIANKFSETQKRYLEWLFEGNSIHVLIECFSNIGQVTYSSSLPFKADKRALEGLKKAGMLQFQDETTYGVRWIVVTLSERGHELVREYS